MQCIPPKPYRVNAVRIGSLDATSGGTYIRVVVSGGRGAPCHMRRLQPLLARGAARLPPAACCTRTCPQNTVAHKQFDKSQYGLRGFQNDIALLQLATPFTGAAPALLPPAAAATDEGLGLGLGNGAPLTVSGFGKTSDTDPSVGDNVLR